MIMQIKVVGVFLQLLHLLARAYNFTHVVDSLVSRYFRDSRNEREPTEAAPGDHVGHQADDREAYLSQTQQDGIRRGRLGPQHT